MNITIFFTPRKGTTFGQIEALAMQMDDLLKRSASIPTVANGTTHDFVQPNLLVSFLRPLNAGRGSESTLTAILICNRLFQYPCIRESRIATKVWSEGFTRARIGSRSRRFHRARECGSRSFPAKRLPAA